MTIPDFDSDDPVDVRAKIDEGLSARRLAQELARAKGPAVGVVIGFLITIGCAVTLFRNITAATGDYRSAYEVSFVVDNANGVVPGRNEVRIAGVPVGKITTAKLEDGRAVVTARILTEHGRVYRNAQARLRPTTALNDMYLDIVSRGSEAGGVADADEPIVADRTAVAEGIGPVLQTFDADTRARMHELLSSLGGGLDDHGQNLQAAFVAAVPFVRDVARLSQELETHDRQTRRLVTNTAQLTGELRLRQDQLRSLVARGADVLEETAGHAAALDRTLAQLPGFLTEIRSAFAVTRDTLPAVDGAVTRLRPIAARLESDLGELRGLSADAAPAVAALREPVRRLGPLADSLVPLSSSLEQTVDNLAPQVPEIDHVTKSVAGCGTPVNYFFQWTPSVFKLGDAYSGGPRGDANFGPDSSSALPDPANRASPDSCAPGTVKGATP
jgi:virulence factor Mce-like protein